MTEQDLRRGRLRAVDDQQTIVTRARLVSSFRAAATDRVPRLSVRWLCERAGVARSTFYTHFSSVEDLAAFVVTEDFDEFAVIDAASRASGVAGATAARAGLEKVVRALADRRSLLEYTFAATDRSVVVDRMITWFARYTFDAVAADLADADGRRARLVVGFVSAGVVHTVLAWLDAQDRLDESDLVDVLLDLLPERLRSPADRGGQG